MKTLRFILCTLGVALSMTGLAYDTEYDNDTRGAPSTILPSFSGLENRVTQHVGLLVQDGHIMMTPDAIEWRDGPPSLPAGAQFVVLEGSPAAEGPLTLRLKFPPGFEIPAHWHPALEHVTVLSGTFYMGMGDELDRASGTEFPAGSFVVMPIGVHHFAWTGDEEVVVQLHSTGPFDSIYVNPADDPRNP